MRRVGVLVLGTSLVIWSAVNAQPPEAAQVLTSAREALGGEKNLSALTSFVATGRTRQLRGNNLVPIEFEINCEVPTRYVRKDEIPAQDTDITVAGFDGDTLLQAPALGAGRAGVPAGIGAGAGRGGPPPPAGGGRGGPAIDPVQQRLTGLKQDFARLMLGVLATSTPAYPLTFTYVAVGEAPEGKADVLEASGANNFSARLVIQQQTHLPAMLIWRTPAGNPPRPVEYRMYFGDYRDVNGIKWPFRIRRAVAGETIEETTFDRVRINVKIDRKKFEVPK